MSEVLFEGSGVALITPFAGDGINEKALRELVRFQLREGSDALIVNGSTGEAATMTREEQRRTIQVVLEEARGSARGTPVVAGIAGSSTADVVHLALQARDAGADALLLSPPPYNKPSQAGILAHYRRVLDAADLPVIVYNIPSRTACNIAPETIQELAADERIVGVKEASGDIAQIVDLARLVADRVTLYSGNDDQVLPLLALGGKGVISVLANIAPRDSSRMVHAFREGDLQTARALQFRYLPVVRVLFAEPNPTVVKAAVEMLGFEAGEPRLPLLPVQPQTRERLRNAMQTAGIYHPAA